jgi:hypothetical protein
MTHDPEQFEAETAALREDLQRRREALKSLRYSSPRVTEPSEPLLSATENAAVARFVRAGNAAEADALSWAEWVDSRIAGAVEARSASITEAVGEYVAEALREEREALQREFQLKLLELKTDLTERMCQTLERLRAFAGDTTTDLPKWPGGAAVN